MALPFIDSNVMLCHLHGQHPEHSPRSTALLDQVERGELQAQLSDIVIFETVFTLERHYKTPKAQIRNSVLALLDLPGLVLQGKRRYIRIFDFYVDYNISFGDACIAAEMEHHGATEVYSFDRQFNRVPGITRLEPETVT
jgi:predicted nucleic acid-binding protein